jgi:hypothetical protein
MFIATTGAQATAMISGAPVTSGGTLFDFEGFADLTNADNLFAAQGLMFQSDGMFTANSKIRHAPRADWTALSGIAVLENPDNLPTDMSMLFSTPRSAIEFYFSDDSPLGDYVFTAFGAGDVVLESVTLTPSYLFANSRFAFVTFLRGGADIVKLSIDSQAPGEFDTDYYGIDDLRLDGATGSVAMPEPGTLAILGLGLAGLGLARCRRVI